MHASEVIISNNTLSIQKSQIMLYESDSSLNLARLIFTQILMPIVCITGITTNVLNIIVLMTTTMRSSTSCYLCAVAVYDLLYSLTGLPLTLRAYTLLEKSPAYMQILTFLLSFGNVWSNTAAWLTCTFTIERFLAISTPIRSRKYFSIKQTKVNIAFVCILVALFTLPDFFEREVQQAHGKCPNETDITLPEQRQPTNNIKTCGEIFYVFQSTWVNEQMKRIGWSYATAALFVFIPLIILTIFNSLLIRSVVKASRRRGFMMGRSQSSNVYLVQKITSNERCKKDLAWRKWWINRQFSERSMSNPVSHTCINLSRSGVNQNRYVSKTGIVEGKSLVDSRINNKPLNADDKELTTYSTVPTNNDRLCEPKNFSKTTHSTVTERYGSSMHRSSNQDKNAITITLIAVVVVFCVLNLPSAALLLIRSWYPANDVSLKIAGNVINFLLMLNSSLNFFLYSLFSARFRRSFRTVFMRICC